MIVVWARRANPSGLGIKALPAGTPCKEYHPHSPLGELVPVPLSPSGGPYGDVCLVCERAVAQASKSR